MISPTGAILGAEPIELNTALAGAPTFPPRVGCERVDQVIGVLAGA